MADRHNFSIYQENYVTSRTTDILRRANTNIKFPILWEDLPVWKLDFALPSSVKNMVLAACPHIRSDVIAVWRYGTASNRLQPLSKPVQSDTLKTNPAEVRPSLLELSYYFSQGLIEQTVQTPR